MLNQNLKWQKRKSILSDIEDKNIELIQNLSKEHVLLCGYPKSGNTWLRFFLAHYSILQNDQITSTITYSELNKIQNWVLEYSLEKEAFLNQSEDLINKIIWTHEPMKREYLNCFSKYLLIFRNPLDTLVSSWHYHVKNRTDLSRIGFPKNNIDAYVKLRYVDWEKYMLSYAQLDADQVLAISYEKLLESPIDNFKKVIEFCYPIHKLDEGVLKRAVDLSSFNAVRNMGKANNQKFGMAQANKGEFTRKGKVGSYKDELLSSTIDYITKKTEKNSIISSLDIKF
jgi:hypothetical protein